MQRILFIIVLVLLLEVYTFQAFKTITSNNIARICYILFHVLTYVIVAYIFVNINRKQSQTKELQFAISLVAIAILPKVITVLFLLVDELLRVGSWVFDYISTKNAGYYPDRRKFISLLGLGLAGITSLFVIDGILFGKYRYRVRKVKLKLPHLPKSFKGYKILQISDVHSGSFTHPEKLQNAINLINKQDADLILFTGDMVNNLADEFTPFISLFKDIKSKDGKLSILGNHDYGDYVEWNSKEEKAKNLELLIKLQNKAGFDVLLNENRTIEKNGEKLYILGVENWGVKPFPQFGDLDKAAKNIPQNAVKILMSHDPSHFDKVVKHHPSNIDLTLSGHTHGMQFGLDLKNIQWSPVQYKYPKWAGLYKESNHYLYVNRGFGVLAYPGRIGMDPEITVIELI